MHYVIIALHYLVIIAIVGVIIYHQRKLFEDTKEKLDVFKDIFTKNKDDYFLKNAKTIEAIDKGKWKEHSDLMTKYGLDISKFEYTQKDDKGETQSFYRRQEVVELLTLKAKEVENGIDSKHDNPIFLTIKKSINDYLQANRSGVNDFHLMKDIVDRNCDALEEEINTQIPIPLYWGLAGAMGGIIVGIGFLWLSGGLRDLLTAGSDSSGADGVKALFGGVVLAMIASISGILHTTISSIKAKDAKAKVEREKHIFLSWIQTKLLPSLSNDMAATLEKMSQNLVAFNNTFSSNTSELGKAFSQVNESFRHHVHLLDAVKQIADKDVSAKNLQLYNALKSSTSEIGTLATYLNNVNDYLANVRALNDKLDAGEQRTKSIEDMAAFFKTEIQQIEARKGVINKAVGTVDSVLQESLGKLKDHANDQLEELKKTTGKQADFLQQNNEQINTIVLELRNLTAVKESILKFEQATRAQNSKLDNLATAIQALANARVEGKPSPNWHYLPNPRKRRVLIWVLSFVIGLLVLFLAVANWALFRFFIM